MINFKGLKFKKHIASLFNTEDTEQYYNKFCWERTLSLLFALDPKAEVRIHINNEIYFIQITDMEEELANEEVDS